MRELATEIDVLADVNTVWGILTDLDNYRLWNPFIRSARGSVTEGARLEICIESPGGKPMVFKPTVLHVDVGREFRWLGQMPIPGVFAGEHIFEIIPSDKGILFSHREEFRGMLVPFLWRSLNENTREGFQAMNHALKQRAETARATGLPT